MAWSYYIVDAWRFPLFSVPGMGYPEGGSVLFNDALPLTALATKVVYQVWGLRVNPFGWWIVLTYVLQGVLAARVVRAVGVHSIWACGAAAILTICGPAFLRRLGHTALSSHFLILWALALHFESLRGQRARVGEWCGLLALALLVNPYLFVIVATFEAVTLLALWTRGQLTARDLRAAAVGSVGVIALAVAAGYGFMFVPSRYDEGAGLRVVLVEHDYAARTA